MIKFKIGDIVKVVSKSMSEDGKKLNGKIGKILRIKNIERSNTVEWYCILDIEYKLPKGPGGIWLSEIELTEESPIKQFGIVKFCKENYR